MAHEHTVAWLHDRISALRAEVELIREQVAAADERSKDALRQTQTAQWCVESLQKLIVNLMHHLRLMSVNQFNPKTGFVEPTIVTPSEEVLNEVWDKRTS